MNNGLLDPRTVAMLQANARPPAGGMQGRAVYRNGQLVLPDQEQQKTQGRGGFLTSIISELGGAGGATAGAATGAALGSVVPGVGTVLGGIAGGVLGGFAGGTGGRLAENKIRDDEFRLTEALKEGAMSGAFGGAGGAFHGLKAAKAIKHLDKLDDATKAAAGIDDLGKSSMGLKEAFKQSGATKQQINEAIKLTKGIGKTTTATQGMGKTSKFGLRQEGAAYGINPGAKVSGKELTRTQSDDLAKWVSKNFKPGTPNQMLDQIEPAITQYNDELAGLVSKSSKKISSQKAKTFYKETLDELRDEVPTLFDDAGKPTAKLNNMLRPYQKGGTIQAFEKKRKATDKLINFARSSTKDPELEQAARYVRNKATGIVNDAVGGSAGKKEFISNALKAQEAITRVAKPPMGFGGGITNRVLESAPIEGARAVLGRGATKAGNLSTAMSQAGAKKIAKGTLARGVGNAAFGTGGQPTDAELQMQGIDPATGQPLQAQIDPITGAPVGGGGLLDSGIGGVNPLAQAQAPVAQSPYTRENLLADIQRDPANADDYIAYFQKLDEVFNPQAGGMDLTNSAINTISEFDNSLANLDEVEALVQSQPGTFNPVMGRLRSLNPFDQSAANVNQATLIAAQNIGRALEGGKLTDADIARYQAALPNINDSPQVAQQKIDRLRFLIQNQQQNFINLQGQYGGGGGGGAFVDQAADAGIYANPYEAY